MIYSKLTCRKKKLRPCIYMWNTSSGQAWTMSVLFMLEPHSEGNGHFPAMYIKIQ